MYGLLRSTFLSFLCNLRYKVFCISILHPFSAHHWLELEFSSDHFDFWNFEILFKTGYVYMARAPTVCTLPLLAPDYSGLGLVLFSKFLSGYHLFSLLTLMLKFSSSNISVLSRVHGIEVLTNWKSETVVVHPYMSHMSAYLRFLGRSRGGFEKEKIFAYSRGNSTNSYTHLNQDLLDGPGYFRLLW
jgi:hypothetical protein